MLIDRFNHAYRQFLCRELFNMHIQNRIALLLAFGFVPLFAMEELSRVGFDYDFRRISFDHNSKAWVLDEVPDRLRPDHIEKDIQALLNQEQITIPESAQNSLSPLISPMQVIEYNSSPDTMPTDRFCALSPDGTRLITGSENKKVHIVDADSGKEVSAVTHDKEIFDVTMSHDGTRFASRAIDKVYIIDTNSGQVLREILHHPYTTTVALNSNGTMLAIGSFGYIVPIIDTDSGQTHHQIKHKGWVQMVALSANGTRLATGDTNNCAYIYKIPSGERLHIIKHETCIQHLALSADGTRLLTVSDQARIFDTISGVMLPAIRNYLGINSVSLSADGTRLAIGSYVSAQIFDVTTGKRHHIIDQDDHINSVALNHDGTRLVTASDTKVRVFDLDKPINWLILHLLKQQHEQGTPIKTATYPTLQKLIAQSPERMQQLMLQYTDRSKPEEFNPKDKSTYTTHSLEETEQSQASRPIIGTAVPTPPFSRTESTTAQSQSPFKNHSYQAGGLSAWLPHLYIGTLAALTPR